MAEWSAKALLITAGAFLVGGARYARSATVPLIVGLSSAPSCCH